MSNSCLLAAHASDKIVKDPIFIVSGKAKVAKERFGAAQVVDGSIGVLLEDSGKLALLPSVDEAMKSITTADIAQYAPIAGTPEFRQDVPAYLFGSHLGELPTDCLATAGATGAVRLVVWNFLDLDEAFVTHDYFWAPYRNIATDCMRRLELFSTYDAEGEFNVAAAIDCLEGTLRKQNRALLVINTPCNNPTGVSVRGSRCEQLRNGLFDLCERYPHKSITLLIDGAYWEFGDEAENRHLLSLFRDLPPNFLFSFAFSLSKSLTRYGLRTGALVLSTREKRDLEDIVGTLSTSIRATWSNSVRLGQVLFSRIFRDESLLHQLRTEQNAFAELCNNRGRLFIEEADKLGLPHVGYHSGFFTTIPVKDSQVLAERLFERNMFFVPLSKGLRIAFCAIPTQSIPGLAAKVLESFEA